MNNLSWKAVCFTAMRQPNGRMPIAIAYIPDVAKAKGIGNEQAFANLILSLGKRVKSIDKHAHKLLIEN